MKVPFLWGRWRWESIQLIHRKWFYNYVLLSLFMALYCWSRYRVYELKDFYKWALHFGVFAKPKPWPCWRHFHSWAAHLNPTFLQTKIFDFLFISEIEFRCLTNLSIIFLKDWILRGENEHLFISGCVESACFSKRYLQIIGIVNSTFPLALGVMCSSRGAFLSI